MYYKNNLLFLGLILANTLLVAHPVLKHTLKSVETFYTKSNDTKMIPNTFDGLVISSEDISNSSIKLAYLFKQKLRDHEENHSVFMVGDANATSGVNHPEWSENDDSAIHTSILYIDDDQKKDEADSMFYYAGIVQNIPSMPEIQYRIRFGYRDFIGASSSISDYIDSRLEFNYLL
jgi:hypothetical protein